MEEQVSDLISKRNMASQDAHRVLERHYMSEGDQSRKAEGGGQTSIRRAQGSEIDVEMEVQKALEAFKSGVYVILVDGRRVMGLDERLSLGLSTKITFLRLTPLVGG